MATLHALLVGIDAYPRKPLYGCVNDIDAIQRVLRRRLGVPVEQIRRLASPHAGAVHETEVPALQATRANLRAALAALAAEARAGDRVFIYYSGHGIRIPFVRPDKRTFHREALAPVDYNAVPGQQLVFDHELNALLGEITAVTRSVACVLDCCHAAGASRSQLTTRMLPPPAPVPVPELEDDAEAGPGVARGVADCMVVAACMNVEVAAELPGGDGVVHGVLTRALLEALAARQDAELEAVSWSAIWQAMRASVKRENPDQNPWRGSGAARAVFAGPPVDGDAGFPIARDGERYAIEAGSLAQVTASAVIAVYGERPARFPPLGSDAELAARLGTVRVLSAEPARAYAIADGAPFELPPGARGRLVEAGEAARLRYAVVPADPAVIAWLAGSPLLELAQPERAQVRLERDGERWALTDDVRGLDHPLVTLADAELVRVRDVLEHYYFYSLPLRLSASALDLPGALRVSLLVTPDRVAAADAQDPRHPEAPSTGSSTYDIPAATRGCFVVRNTSDRALTVTLVCSASSGKVVLLGSQQINAAASFAFWSRATLGRPFVLTPPKHTDLGIDRVVAIGTTSAGIDLDYLRLDRSFADVARTSREIGDEDDEDEADTADDLTTRARPPADQWTATQTIITMRRGCEPQPASIPAKS